MKNTMDLYGVIVLLVRSEERRNKHKINKSVIDSKVLSVSTEKQNEIVISTTWKVSFRVIEKATFFQDDRSPWWGIP